MKLKDDNILVLDFGSQYTQLIARRVREHNVYCQLVRHDLSASRIRQLAPKGIILSGGPSSVYDTNAPACDPEIFKLGIPILGICYGMQLLCQSTGGKVVSVSDREYGRSIISVEPDQIVRKNSLFSGFDPQTQVWMSHGDQVEGIADDFISLASTSTCPYAAIAHKSMPFYGIQFHPEVTHTIQGGLLLKNFLRNICGCECTWTMEDFARQTIEQVRAQVGNKRVICGLSGGVDSAVVAALLSQAIGNRLTCILVDNGLLRKNEAGSVIHEFTNNFKSDLHVVRAEDRFLSVLEGVTDPQEKRRRIGKAFIDCFQDEARKVEDAEFLAQGTLYPDVIESGGTQDGPAATIKLHHNVGGLPEKLGFTLVEPLRDLFKDEVRKLGTQLGLPDEIVWRHPFPGPGLAVRCLGEVTRPKLEILREADAILIEEIRNAGLYRATSQTFAVLLPVQTVGVMGDSRTYDNVITLRSVTSEDFMTADWSRLPYDLMATISTRIINEVKGVNRVVYDITSKPPATIEWE